MQENMKRLNGKNQIIIFLKIIVKKVGALLDDGYFDMWKYTKFYCEQDTNLLKLGMVSFGNDLMEELDIEIDNYLTISSISHDFFH